YRARHGKMDIRRGSSVQSDGIALTMSLCSANDISAICSIPTKNITTKLGRTYRCTRTPQSHVLSRPSVARWRCQFWAGCITNISGRKFPTGTGFNCYFLPDLRREEPSGGTVIDAVVERVVGGAAIAAVVEQIIGVESD